LRCPFASASALESPPRKVVGEDVGLVPHGTAVLDADDAQLAAAWREWHYGSITSLVQTAVTRLPLVRHRTRAAQPEFGLAHRGSLSAGLAEQRRKRVCDLAPGLTVLKQRTKTMIRWRGRP
jgi:hypothetical protein